MPEWLNQAMPAIGAALGIYAGIRADIAAIRAKADQAQREADRANSRIDLMQRAVQ